MQKSEKEKLILDVMNDTKKKILQYLKSERSIISAALKMREDDASNPLLKDLSQEVQKMREVELMKLRHSVNELDRHIAVIELL